MTKPNFEVLRATRTERMQKLHAKLASELGCKPEELKSNYNPNACYCACSTGGPCEHDWTGPDWESEDGCACSVTCARCGTTAMSHDMRVGL
jgi:hypothetical protein